MLISLRIRNLALVDQLLVEFRPGLNMITGETGAGKSILIGALGLLLGERADKSLIRSGEDNCGAEAAFELPDSSEIDLLLEEYGLPPCEEGQLIVRRVVRASGTGQILVNDSPVTLQVLKRLGDCLVDMHGPHDHQSLLRQEAQLEILDSFGHLWKEREAYEELYRDRAGLMKRREELLADDEDLAARLELLEHRVKEIEEASLTEEEEQQVERDHAILGNAQRVLELAGEAVNALMENDASAFNAMAGAQRALEDLARIYSEAEGWREDLRTMASRVQELSTDIGRMADRLDADPSRLEWIDQRMTTYQRLKRKYGPTVPDVLATLETNRQRLEDLTSRGARLEEVERALRKKEQVLREAGERLRGKRTAAAGRLAKDVTAELRDLGFPHGTFSVALTEVVPRADGMDEIEFGFEPNVGEVMRPLRQIASSGEISRVMLATKTVLAKHDRIPILVFDEIDANVGGEIAGSVGQKLAAVAGHHQVICITHLPQVASMGDAHFAVAKFVREGRTFTGVRSLDEAARVDELARMLGGRDGSDVTVQHARELLAKGARMAD